MRAAVVVFLLAACSTSTPSTPADKPAPAAQPRQAQVQGLTIAAFAADRGEDGAGNVVPAVRPVAIDVVAAEWGGRALDPVLTIGRLHFHHYTFPAPGVMRFVAADGDAIPTDGEAFVQFGDDLSSRVVIR